jgi:hypothetical protein
VCGDQLRSIGLSTSAVLRAQSFTWRSAAERFDDIVRDTSASHLVSCA